MVFRYHNQYNWVVIIIIWTIFNPNCFYTIGGFTNLTKNERPVLCADTRQTGYAIFTRHDLGDSTKKPWKWGDVIFFYNYHIISTWRWG